jgi:antitoxin HigA-1
MISRFRHKGLERFFKAGDHRGIPAQHAARIERILDRLDSALRMTFRFEGKHAVAVDLEDYHLMRSLRDPKRKPTHPGAVLREGVLPALRMTQTEFARRLGVSRLTVSELLLEKRGLSPEIAARIGRLLDTTPESWLRMQEALDLWQVNQHPEKLAAIQPIKAVA